MAVLLPLLMILMGIGRMVFGEHGGKVQKRQRNAGSAPSIEATICTRCIWVARASDPTPSYQALEVIRTASSKSARICIPVFVLSADLGCRFGVLSPYVL